MLQNDTLRNLLLRKKLFCYAIPRHQSYDCVSESLSFGHLKKIRPQGAQSPCRLPNNRFYGRIALLWELLPSTTKNYPTHLC